MKIYLNLLPPKATLQFSTDEPVTDSSGKLSLEKRVHSYDIFSITKVDDSTICLGGYNGYHTKAPDSLEEILGVSDHGIKREGPKECTFETLRLNLEVKGDLDEWVERYLRRLSQYPENTSEAPLNELMSILQEASNHATNTYLAGHTEDSE